MSSASSEKAIGVRYAKIEDGFDEVFVLKDIRVRYTKVEIKVL